MVGRHRLGARERLALAIGNQQIATSFLRLLFLRQWRFIDDSFNVIAAPATLTSITRPG